MEEPPGVASVDDSLEELLRRAHRSELLPLAGVLGVNHEGLGLGDLVRSCERTLRRRGAHDFANIVFRSGEGPDYAEVLQQLALRRRVPLVDDLDALEEAVVDQWIVETWSKLDQASRDRVWTRLQLRTPAPESAESALTNMRERFVGASRYAAVQMALEALRYAPLVVPPLLPLAGCLGLWNMAAPKDSVLLPAVLEVSALRQTVRHRLTVGIVGSPSSGKDAAIGAIFGIESGNVNPVAGSTREVEITQLDGASALYVVNTPGMGDIIESVTEEAKQVLGLIDLFIYVVNAQGGVQARELADYRACLDRDRPVLAVVNKIDTLREADRERYLADAREKLGAPEEGFLAVAFDPLPQLSEAPINLEPVRAWIEARVVELGKDVNELPWAQSATATRAP